MKRLGGVVVIAVGLGLLSLVFFRPSESPQRFATPAECLEAYREASLAGDVAGYLECLDGPLRRDKERAATPDGVRRDLAGIKSWTEHEPVAEGSTAHIDVDLTRLGDTRRIRFHFRRTAEGWRISAIALPAAVPTAERFGTPAE
jgi:hypothetical protein